MQIYVWMYPQSAPAVIRRLLATFITIWVQLIYGVTAAKRIWAQLIGESVVGHSNVRWYVTMEIMMQIARHWTSLQALWTKLAEGNIAQTLRQKIVHVHCGPTPTSQ